MFNFLKNISPTELIIIVLILVILFGGKAAIKLGRLGGETVREIKKVKKNITEDDDDKK